jgi:hypothetical protein
MAAPSWTQTIDTMFTTTWAYRKDAAIEQAYLKTPFWFWLKEKGKIKSISGYRRIEIPLEYGENETATWLQKGATMPMVEGELATLCYEDWKYMAVNILRYGIEDQQNKGAARIQDYVGMKIKAAERAINKDMERVVFADGTGTNEPNGLRNLISATPTLGTLHGLSRVTYDWWRNLQYSSLGVTSVYLLSDMRTAMNNMTLYEGLEIKDIFMLTTQAVFEAYEDELLEYQKYTTTKLIDAGFDTLNFKGRPLMWAPSCPAGYMYFINPEYLYPVKDPDYFMDMTEWKPIPDQVNDKTAQIVNTIQLICSRPISQQVMTGITVG